MQAAGLETPRQASIILPCKEWSRALRGLSVPPSAVFISSAPHFPQLHEGLKGGPLEPGVGLAIGVYDDNLWHSVEPLKIPYLRIDQPLEQIACSAVTQMMKMLQDEHYHPTDQLLPSRVVQVDGQGRCREL